MTRTGQNDKVKVEFPHRGQNLPTACMFSRRLNESQQIRAWRTIKDDMFQIKFLKVNVLRLFTSIWGLHLQMVLVYSKHHATLNVSLFVTFLHKYLTISPTLLPKSFTSTAQTLHMKISAASSSSVSALFILPFIFLRLYSLVAFLSSVDQLQTVDQQRTK